MRMNENSKRPPDEEFGLPDSQEWLRIIESVLQEDAKDRAAALLERLRHRLPQPSSTAAASFNTPYINTIPPEKEPPYPGDRKIERRIKSLIRWNAMAMVVKANRNAPGIGGHISTFASVATLYEVGFNHFFQGKNSSPSGDQVYFQGHASPGVYARAFLEGRLTEEQLHNFRREFGPGGGLSSYPHPWLMPDFWEFPTVSMGLSPLLAIYQARFNRYLAHRRILDTGPSRVWAFLGDGEMDEPESLGAITLASREKLDNLIFVINCNLQRLDGPVRGNGKIIQELEAAFRGAGWNVIKVVWGSEWDPLLQQDRKGLLVKRMNEVVDGYYQKYSVEGGAYAREHFFGAYPELREMVEHYTDDQIHKLRRGGHDSQKVYAAYQAAVEHRGSPTVILAKTVKGYGLGEAGEGRNITHQQKKLNEKELLAFKKRFDIPIPDKEVADAPFYRPPEDSSEMQYLLERRRRLGGFLPERRVHPMVVHPPESSVFQEFLDGSKGREVSTTMGFSRLLSRLLSVKDLGRHIVPIIPDEARTFGLETLFRQFGIYASAGQLYEPVDVKSLLYYYEAKDGQILEEGINEAGAMASFIAAGTSYATHGIPMIPFFIYYSMFGFQRIGDLIWAAGDMRAKGFMLGATSGRTTLNGEGLQHQDGHSHLLASAFPAVEAYDPAYIYEIAVIVQEGLRRMLTEQNPVIYYITLGNETMEMPVIPPGSETGILKGLYKFRPGPPSTSNIQTQILGSGALLREALRAQEILLERFAISSDVWSVTSYKKLREDAMETDRWNRLHPTAPPRMSYLQRMLEDESGPFVSVTDSMRAVSDQIAPWIPGGLISLGTDGFGRSDTREALRRWFEVNAEQIVVAVLYALKQRGQLSAARVERAIKEMGIDPDQPFSLRH
ncbi:MAG: pyruvate dehydrogenase (acetyl-transferring), homodimeric type [Nitrospirae bacterium]|nr:pyruvate dehydrogenase (acetyl-transferring), homodimeric type [Nitrospirota bacterium]